MNVTNSQTARCALLLCLLCVALASSVFVRRDIALVFADSVQPLSMADNIREQGNLGTSVLRYPEHFEFGTVPAPQTVWPPGMGLAVAAVSLFGMSSANALTTITFVSAFTVPLLIFFALIRFGRPPVAALLASLFVLSLPWYWTYTLRLMSEMPFLMLTLIGFVSILTAIRRDFDLRFIALGALVSGFAYLTRYSGAFFIFASGVVLVALALRVHGWRAWRAAVLYGAITGSFILWLTLRNMELTHKISGGQFEPTTPLGFERAVVHLYWSIKNMIQAWFIGNLPDMFVLPIVLLMFGAFGWLAFRSARDYFATPTPNLSSIAVLYGALYVGITFVVHVISAALKAGWFLDEPRYFFVLLPIAVFATAMFTAPQALLPYRVTTPIRAIGLVVFGAMTLHAVFASRDSQLVHFRDRYDETAHAITTRISPDSPATIGEYLRERAHPNRAVLTTHPESLYIELGVPSVGLTESRFMNVHWDVQRTQTLLCTLPVDYLLIIGHHVNTADDNAEFFREILDGHEPRFLRRLGGDVDVSLLSVDRSALGDACVT
jgi:hypothetical protein